MSWDLAFWKSVGTSSENAGTTHNSLGEDEEPNGLDWIAVSDIRIAFQAIFADIEVEGTELLWEGAGSYFQVSWPVGSKPGHTLGVFVSCGWNLMDAREVIQQLRAVGLNLGCGVYDPQSDEWTPPTTSSRQ